MSLTANITPKLLPNVFDADVARNTRDRFQHLDATQQDMLSACASVSPYLAHLLNRHAAWIETALTEPDAALQNLFPNLEHVAASTFAVTLREAKGRAALLIALADLVQAWPLQRVTTALTRFADAATHAALTVALREQINRGALPALTTEDAAERSGFAVFAMGKMGAYELNYSSDIDLICLFDETRFDAADYPQMRAGFIKATRRVVALLSEVTSDGYVFRTDLRLRPDPSVTPVCMSIDAAMRYYESLGRTWERAAWIKARVCAGDQTSGKAFLDSLQPFVWRRHLDFAAVEDAHDMRLAIRDHKGLGGAITLPGHNMKLGRGGIREIEFFTQTRQLIAGGRDPNLRARGTCDGLRALSDAGWIAPDIRERLTEHYVFHRTIEHRLQMVRDAQTHSLPTSDAEFDRLAAMMVTDTRTLKAELTRRLTEIHATTERFFAPKPSAQPVAIPDDVQAWLRYPALRTDRAQAKFTRLLPDITQRLNAADRPAEAFAAFDRFLAGLPAGVQLFSLFEANPQILTLLIDIVTVSPDLGAYLSRNSQVLDAVIGGSFFDPWPDFPTLRADLSGRLQRASDHETWLDAARRWGKEWHFRIGVHVLQRLVSAEEAGAQYAMLAQATIDALWPYVVQEVSRKHGVPPGHGAVVLGMGSLGAGRLHAQSDLDVIVLYDPADIDSSDGPRPLATRAYYARLTQALITAITTQTAAGRLYELDMRLRPSGNKGPVATSLAAFTSYQTENAWVWEHLALTRARPVAGEPDLSHRVDETRLRVIAGRFDRVQVLADLADMRRRLLEAKGAPEGFEPKTGPGRLQDIELFSQAGALLCNPSARDVPAALAACATAGLLGEAEAGRLQAQYDRLWALQVALRVILPETGADKSVKPAGAAFLAAYTGYDTPDALLSALDAATADAAAIIDKALPGESA